MPTIFFYGPELPKEKKKELVKSITDSASKVTGIPPASFTVMLRPTSQENVGIGGELLSERRPR